MILMSNLPALRARAGAAARVLDVGGWFHPFNLATHVIDLAPYATHPDLPQFHRFFGFSSRDGRGQG